MTRETRSLLLGVGLCQALLPQGPQTEAQDLRTSGSGVGLLTVILFYRVCRDGFNPVLLVSQ